MFRLFCQKVLQLATTYLLSSQPRILIMKILFIQVRLLSRKYLHMYFKVRGFKAELLKKTYYLSNIQIDQRQYNETLSVCSMERDMQIMENGNQTVIGKCELNLSGGQKQSIHLAHIAYQDCNVYLLDNISSTVDAHIKSAIFKISLMVHLLKLNKTF